MSDFFYEAPPMSRQQIVTVALAVREVFSLSAPYLPVERLIEHYLPEAAGIEFDVMDAFDMGGRHGFWDAGARRLVLRSDVYERLPGRRTRPEHRLP